MLQHIIQSWASIISWTRIVYSESSKANITALDISFFCVSHLFRLRQPHSYEYDNIWIKSLLETAMRPFLKWKRKMLSWLDIFLRTAQVTSPFCSATECHKSDMSHLDPGSQISLTQWMRFLNYKGHGTRSESLVTIQVHSKKYPLSFHREVLRSEHDHSFCFFFNFVQQIGMKLLSALEKGNTKKFTEHFSLILLLATILKQTSHRVQINPWFHTFSMSS